VDDAFGHWLAGLTDGEGCFAITKPTEGAGNYQLRCSFIILLRDDDASILQACQRITGLGKIYHRLGPKGKPSHKPQTRWVVGDRVGCLGIVDLFTRYPLRSKKARVFEIWKQAVMALCKYPKSGNPLYGRSRRPEMEDFRRQIEMVRAYPGDGAEEVADVQQHEDPQGAMSF